MEGILDLVGARLVLPDEKIVDYDLVPKVTAKAGTARPAWQQCIGRRRSSTWPLFRHSHILPYSLLRSPRTGFLSPHGDIFFAIFLTLVQVFPLLLSNISVSVLSTATGNANSSGRRQRVAGSVEVIPGIRSAWRPRRRGAGAKEAPPQAQKRIAEPTSGWFKKRTHHSDGYTP